MTILVISPFVNTEPLVLGWLALMALLIASAPIYLWLATRRLWRRRRKPKASDLLR